jgi:centromere/kinetochore protein ZW10
LANTPRQAEIHAINEETAEDVASWRVNAKSVQDDIVRSKALANDILKQADTPDVSGKRTAEIEAKTNFLARELKYNRQVQDALRGIKAVNQTLDQVEQARDERRIIDALHLLEKSWTQLDQIPVSRSTRALKLLDIRAFELKNDVHEVFDHVWKALVHVDVANGSISVTESREGEHMSLSDAVIGLQAYKEVDKRMKDLWHDVDRAIFSPRMDAANQLLPGIQVQDGVLQTVGTADRSISSLFTDLEQIFGYLVEKLPRDLVATISSVMMPEVITRVTNVWLDSAVPSSLMDMEEFQQVIAVARDFWRSLEALGLKGLGELREWVDSAPRVWLSKCRESALDSVRSRLAEGIGSPQQVEKVEKQMVSRTEGKELTVNTPAAMADVEDHGWGDVWSDEENKGGANPPPELPAVQQPAGGEDDGTDAWGAWNEDDDATEGAPEKPKEEHKDEEEDPADAWGWGDDDQAGDQVKPGAASKPTASGKPQAGQHQVTRELTLKETYYISSMPEPVLALILALVEDGAALTQEHYENSPVAAAAAGLFSLPTLALAMFRAISPHYYASDVGGNM